MALPRCTHTPRMPRDLVRSSYFFSSWGQVIHDRAIGVANLVRFWWYPWSLQRPLLQHMCSCILCRCLPLSCSLIARFVIKQSHRRWRSQSRCIVAPAIDTAMADDRAADAGSVCSVSVERATPGANAWKDHHVTAAFGALRSGADCIQVFHMNRYDTMLPQRSTAYQEMGGADDDQVTCLPVRLAG